MREFNEVWNGILNKKYQKKIEAGYERIFETYSVFFEKAQQMREETEKTDRKSTRLNSSHEWISRMPSSA